MMKGYQPVDGNAKVQRVNFDQYGNKNLQSIFEAAGSEPGQPAVDPTQSSFAEDALISKPVEDIVSKELPVAKAVPLDVPPVAKVAERIALPRDAFKEEFEKAYRYINPSPQIATAERLRRSSCSISR